VGDLRVRAAPVLEPNPALVDGRAVLLYDDIFTDGLNLNAVAKKLLEAGAAQVCGVTLARQPWR
jgi:predicted amidophosphoribosyltransferase